MSERLKPIVIGANGTATVYGDAIGMFLAVTAGTITVNNAKGVAILSAFPVTAGQVCILPISLASGNALIGGTVVLAGGASGTLLVR